MSKPYFHSVTLEREKCKGCTKCSKVCPVSAISGEVKKPFVIDLSKCIRCGSCVSACPFHAIND